MVAYGLQLLHRANAAYGPEYEKHVFEQFRLCADMAGGVSARRMLANPFFVAVHTVLVTAFTVLLKEKVLLSYVLLGVTLCNG